MTRLSWRTSRMVNHGRFTLPCAEELEIVIGPHAGQRQVGGIRPNSRKQLIIKSLAWPLVYAHNQLLSTGFLERALGQWMRQYLKSDSVFLEIGAGEMSLRRFLRATVCYNALDIALSEFALRRVVRPRCNVNLALGSVNAIPLNDHCVDVIACKEVLMYVPDVTGAIREIHRVLRQGGKFLCTIGNLHSRKYAVKGRQAGFTSAFGFDEFKSLVESQGLRCIEAFSKGWWVPLPTWLSKTTHQLPITSTDEYHNTNFVYCFEAV